MRRKLLCLMFVLILILLYLASRASAQQIPNGLNYLTTVQNLDGSWGNSASNTDPLRATVAVIGALQALNQTTTSNYANAISWLQDQSLDTTDYLSERIYTLSVAGVEKDLLLSYLDELVKAWGGYDDYGINTLDTALALLALKRINYSDQNIISSALGFLLSSQNPDGGWGFYPSACSNCEADPSNVYITAMVLRTLSEYKTIYNLETAINNGVAYLLTKQNPDGGFGTSPSTICETALAFEALVLSGSLGATSPPVINPAINYLTSTQLPNGSWNDDPYSTALALRALANVKPNLSISSPDITFSNSAPKVGDTITATPKFRFRKLSLRGNRSNLAFFDQIATHLSGTCNGWSVKGFPFLHRDLGDNFFLTKVCCSDIRAAILGWSFRTRVRGLSFHLKEVITFSRGGNWIEL